ncbi:MAG: hypothetical protein JNK19_10700 [Tabrizicola sp.]|nr:hypothetical protein [Tabrizicola sp.]
MAVLPSNLPEGASLPFIVGGALVVAWVISRFSRRPTTTLPHPTPARPKAAGASYDAELQRCRDDLARQFSTKLGFVIRTTSYGAVDIDPVHLAIWFMTDSDAQRDRLLALPDFDQTCRAALAASGYPPQAIPQVHFSAASEETVQRDWGGNWWHFFK